MKINEFETLSTMVLLRGSDNRKYGELIHDFSIQHASKNNQYTEKLQEVVDLMRKVKFKSENNNDESNTQKKRKNGGGEQINQMKRVLH